MKELRRWSRRPGTGRWGEFRSRYEAELVANDEGLEALRARIGRGNATLLFAAADTEYNHAIVLRDLPSRRSKHR